MQNRNHQLRLIIVDVIAVTIVNDNHAAVE